MLFICNANTSWNTDNSYDVNCKLGQEKDNTVYQTERRSEHTEVQTAILHLPLFYWSLLLLKWLTSASLFLDLQQIFKDQPEENPSFRFSGIVSKLPFSGHAATSLGCLPAKLQPSSEPSPLRCQSCSSKVCTRKGFWCWRNYCLWKGSEPDQVLPTAQCYLGYKQKNCHVPSTPLGLYMGQVLAFQNGQADFGPRTPLPEHPWLPMTPFRFVKSLLPFQQGKLKFQTPPVEEDCYVRCAW